MMKRRYFIYITLLITGIFVTISCGDKKTEEKVVEDINLKVAVTPTFDCLPIIVAVDKGWAGKAGLPLDIAMYQAHNDVDTAIEKGRVVAGFTDNVRAAAMNAKVKGLQILPHENLSWQLIASGGQRITEVKQLKDKMIGMTRLSATEQLSQHIMTTAKLTDQQTFLIPVNSLTIRLKMLNSNEIDAAWLPEPQASQALAAGGKKLIASSQSSDAGGANGSNGPSGSRFYGVVVFPTKSKIKSFKPLTEQQRKEFQKLYNEACDSLNKRGMNTYSSIIGKRLGLTEKDVKKVAEFKFIHL